MAGRVLEKTVVKKIKDMLEKDFPGFYFKSHGSGYQKTGIPDILGCHKGIFIGIEVKTPKTKNNVSELQKKCIRDINQAGGIAFVAWDENDVKTILTKEIKEYEERISKRGNVKRTGKIKSKESNTGNKK